MAVYGIEILATASQWVEVEAETLEEAEDMAHETASLRPCIHDRFDMGEPYAGDYATRDGVEIPKGATNP